MKQVTVRQITLSKNLWLNVLAAGLSLAASVVAIVAWGQSLNWHVFGASTYLLFPVFGLLAFSLMWAQYIASTARQILSLDSKILKTYSSVIGFLVLAFILLHPGLLIWQRWRDGFGLPPGSELHYVLPGLGWLTILGMINLTILLLFELRRVLAKRSWWHWTGYLVDLVMFSIFYHSIKLGTQLQNGWLRKVWFFYGATLAACLLYVYSRRFLVWRKKLVAS